MKTVLSLLLSLACVSSGFAQAAAEKKAMPKKPAAEKPAPPAAAAKSEEATPAKDATAQKALPMNVRVDAIDPASKSFSMTRKKDKVTVKHIVTTTTDIKNAGAAATFEDIKVGDMVAGSRVKKSDTEYEVIKVTKFGPADQKAAAAPKADGAAKPEGAGKP